MNRTILLVVNYHAETELAAMIRRIADSGRTTPSRVVIVDNGSAPTSRLERREPRLPVDVLTPPRNLGYFGGAEFACHDESVAGSSWDWLVLANPDVTFADDFFEQLSRLPDGTAEIVAPDIRSGATGLGMNPYLASRPKVSSLLLRQVLLSDPRSATWVERLRRTPVRHAYRNTAKRQRLRDGEGYIYAPHGSLVVCHRRFFARGGSFHHEAFLYGEEITLGERAWRRGMRVWYEPRLRATHQGQVSMGTLRTRRLARYRREGFRVATLTRIRGPRP